jgi:thioredoxin-dependent peroxiredoxin
MVQLGQNTEIFFQRLDMAKITLKGNPVNTNGSLPSVGSKAPDFNLVKTDLSDIKLADFLGKKVVLNVFPSIDTPTCALSTKRFNQEAAKLKNTVVICVSADLPFAQKRFCAAEGIENVTTASSFRSAFGKNYGLEIVDSVLKNLLSRAVVIINAEGKVVYTEQVAEIAQEPNYTAALAAL